MIHLVDEKGAGGRGLHMGRTASIATAAALRGLGPGRRGDEMAQKMLAMFTSPKEHADYLTSPRWAVNYLTFRPEGSVESVQTIGGKRNRRAALLYVSSGRRFSEIAELCGKARYACSAQTGITRNRVSFLSQR